jgi:Fe-S-cluster-containing dehydrogenase component
MERVDEGLKRGLKPGVDREATPACVIICPAKARYFGDLEDADSEIVLLIREKRAVQLHPEYGTEPSLYYVIG